jgi:hypothetical protein
MTIHAGVAQRERLATSQEADGSTPSPRSTSRGPWCVTPEEAVAREKAALALFLDMRRRRLISGMPPDHVSAILAAEGYDAHQLRVLLPYIVPEAPRE